MFTRYSIPLACVGWSAMSIHYFPKWETYNWRKYNRKRTTQNKKHVFWPALTLQLVVNIMLDSNFNRLHNIRIINHQSFPLGQRNLFISQYITLVHTDDYVVFILFIIYYAYIDVVGVVMHLCAAAMYHLAILNFHT